MNNDREINRRDFVTAASAGAGIGLAGITQSAASAEKEKPAKLPREVWIATVSLAGLEADTSESLIQQMLQRMEQTLPSQPDLICLPETFPYTHVGKTPPLSEQAESVPGPIVQKFAAFAEKNHCYVICPLHTKSEGRIYNSAVVIDRQGKVIGQYHKIHPTVDEIEAGTLPGPVKPPVFKTDFGTIGIQICFDVNWHEGWRALREAGAEIIFWPSAFPGGRMLNAMAWINKTYVVTSTHPDPCRIIDITGDDLAVSGRFEHWVCAPINLEKVFLHIWPYTQNIDALRAKYGRKIRVTKMHLEDWAIIENVSPDLSIMDILREFNIPLHEEHIRKAQEVQNKAQKS